MGSEREVTREKGEERVEEGWERDREGVK